MPVSPLYHYQPVAQGGGWRNVINPAYGQVQYLAQQSIRFFATNWNRLQRGRRRFVHIQYPPSSRSAIYKLGANFWTAQEPEVKGTFPALHNQHAWYCQKGSPLEDDGPVTEAELEGFRPESYRTGKDTSGKLVFICHGYVDRIDYASVSPAVMQSLRNSQQQNGGCQPFGGDIQQYIKKTEVTCMCFATPRTHHLLETFTLQEILAFEKLIPCIDEAFESMESQLNLATLNDRVADHHAIELASERSRNRISCNQHSASDIAGSVREQFIDLL